MTSDAANLARELANTPANLLTARTFADRAQALAAEHGLAVEIFDRDQLLTMGCGGILGVNGTVTFPDTPGLLEQPLTTQPGVLTNADGYTTHFNESLTKGDATLNPYRRFFTESDPSAIGEGEFVTFAKMPMACRL